MQLLWIGCLESEEEFKNKVKKGYGLASAQVSQQNLVTGIENCLGQGFDSINGSVLPPYPVYADKIINEVVWQHRPDNYDVSVGYKNQKYVNRMTCKNAMIKAADKWFEERYKGEEVILFVYSMRSAPMATACYLKKKIQKCEAYLIVTDLPQFMDLGQSKLKAGLKKIDWINIKKMQNQFDGFILYASKMAKYLNIPNGKWILMEGSFDPQNDTYPCIKNKRSKAIMYSGKLDMQYGIKLLLDAFMEIKDPEAELWLTGSGNAEKLIKECAKRDSRIKFFGFFPSREEVKKKQQEAAALINMRLPSENASNFCFPSKLFEYMATGIPVLSFKLGGIPEEYYPYLCLIEKECITGVKNAIEAALKPGNKIGSSAREFIMSNKTLDKQCRRIVQWMQIRKN